MIALIGPLGAGKTVFVKGLAEGLVVDELLGDGVGHGVLASVVRVVEPTMLTVHAGTVS